MRVILFTITYLEFMLEIYTDGACRGNGSDAAKASWGYVVLENHEKIHEDCGLVKGKQTNNTGELMAIYEAIYYALENNEESVTIYSDSRYCIDSLSIWNIEKKRKGEYKANYHLIKDILALMEDIDVSFEWVKGHDNNYFNEVADNLANSLLRTNKFTIY